MKWIISLLILFLLESVVYGELLLARTNSSNLCSRIPSQSCLHQLKPSAQDDDHNSRICTVEAANNTHPLLCDGHRWNREEICHHDGCGVHLEIYRHMPYPSLPLFRTALNLTLSNISCSQVKIRFRETSINNLTFCINFTSIYDVCMTPRYQQCLRFKKNCMDGQKSINRSNVWLQSTYTKFPMNYVHPFQNICRL